MSTKETESPSYQLFKKLEAQIKTHRFDITRIGYKSINRKADDKKQLEYEDAEITFRVQWFKELGVKPAADGQDA